MASLSSVLQFSLFIGLLHLFPGGWGLCSEQADEQRLQETLLGVWCRPWVLSQAKGGREVAPSLSQLRPGGGGGGDTPVRTLRAASLSLPQEVASWERCGLADPGF